MAAFAGPMVRICLPPAVSQANFRIAPLTRPDLVESRARREAPPHQQFDQPRIGFRCRKWIGAIDPHRDLSSSTAQLYRYRQDLGFVVRRAWRWRSDIEECTEPGRAQMDIDLIGPTSMWSTRVVRKARCRVPGNSIQLLPISTARDEPALR